MVMAFSLGKIMCGVQRVFDAPSGDFSFKSSSQTKLSPTGLVSGTNHGNNVWRHGLYFHSTGL